MTFPGDDDLVEITPQEMEYEEYDLEWMNEYIMGNRDVPYDENVYQTHELWDVIQRNGWHVIPGTLILQKGGIDPDDRVAGGKYFRSVNDYRFQNEEGTAREIVQRIQVKTIEHGARTYEETMRDPYGETPVIKMSWLHIVGDEKMITEQSMAFRSKYYPSLGLALDEAQRRERGGGFSDYVQDNTNQYGQS